MEAVDIPIQDLLEACRLNNRRGQEALYRAFYGFSMTIALRYSRDEHDAADIVTAAFVKVFKYIHRFDGSKGNLHSWLKRIIVNEGLDHIKSRGRVNENIEIETVAEPQIDAQVLEQMGAEEIMNIVKRLPPATHAVFVMYAVEGYNHREIGEQLGISDGTSKWHLSEARKFLQKALEHLNKH